MPRKIPGVYIKTIDKTTTRPAETSGVPAVTVGHAYRGPAFVPQYASNKQELVAAIGEYDTNDHAAIALANWLEFQNSGAFVRLLGVGNGTERATEGGEVPYAGFTVGEGPAYAGVHDVHTNRLTVGNEPLNQYAIYRNGASGDLVNLLTGSLEDGWAVDTELAAIDTDAIKKLKGNLYFLGAWMKDADDSSYLADAGLQPGTDPVPVIRAAIMVPHGVELRLYNETVGTTLDEYPEPEDLLATFDDADIKGSMIGTLVLERDVTIVVDGTIEEATTSPMSFTMYLNGFNNPEKPAVYEVSLDKNNKNYFTNKLNTNPEKIAEYGHCLYAWWDVAETLAVVDSAPHFDEVDYASQVTQDAVFLVKGKYDTDSVDQPAEYVPDFRNWKDRYQHAKTPWVVSQKFGGVAKKLFKLHMKDDGDITSRVPGEVGRYNVKFTIYDIRPSSIDTQPYGSFNLDVRLFDNLDQKYSAVQSFVNLNLDPNSDQYIAKKLGDSKEYFNFDAGEGEQKLIKDGFYSGLEFSRFVYVEMHPDVEAGAVDAAALPMGYTAVPKLQTAGNVWIGVDENDDRHGLGTLTDALSLDSTKYALFEDAVLPPVPLRKTVAIGTGSSASVGKNLTWGPIVEHPGAADNPNKVAPNSKSVNYSLESFCKYFPTFESNGLKVVEESEETEDCFSLENIEVRCKGDTDSKYYTEDVTASRAVAPDLIKEWRYVRDGTIAEDVDSYDRVQSRALESADLANTDVRNAAGFTFFAFGGFDGTNMFDADANNLTDYAVYLEGSLPDIFGVDNGPTINAYKAALKHVVADKAELDLSLLATPEVRDSLVTDIAVQVANDRTDFLYLMDVEQYNANGDELFANKTYDFNDTNEDLKLRIVHVTNTCDTFNEREVNSTYVASYFPDLNIEHVFLDSGRLLVQAPPSVYMMGLLARNDGIYPSWASPAGETRGAVPNAVSSTIVLNETNLQDLTNASINAVRKLPGKNGLYVWDQKTTLLGDVSALTRVGTRKMLLALRRNIKRVANRILFEPNVDAVVARLVNAMTPFLEAVQSGGGISRYDIQISRNQADVLNNRLSGRVVLYPTKEIEVVQIDFVATNSGFDI